jgi:hypothetical protein
MPSDLLAVIGNISVDTDVHPGRPEEPAVVGGAALHVALAAAHAGLPAAPVSVVGDELRALAAHPDLAVLNLTAVRAAAGPSSAFTMAYDQHGALTGVASAYGVAGRGGLTRHALSWIARREAGSYHVCCRRPLAATAASRLADHVGPDRVFLPFCDPDEDNLVAAVKGRRLYDLDRRRLPGLSGLLAILHGPSLDDGVCMEIGFAAALGAPVVILTTDFITYGMHEDGPAIPFPDPLPAIVAAEIIRNDTLAAPITADHPPDLFTGFAARNTTQLTDGIHRAVIRLLQLARPPRHPADGAAAARPRPARTAFCEPSPYWNDPTWTAIIRELRGAGYQPRLSRRLTAHAGAADAHRDWNTLTGADLLVADVAGPETPPGAAIMIGACRALGRRVLVHHPAPTWTFAPGREPNWRNLMIQYAVDGRFADLPTLRRLLTP